jgi:hypothetical protein
MYLMKKFNYTPEIVGSFHKLPIIQKLLNVEISGKISCYSSRTEIHKEYWPDIFYKPKLVNYDDMKNLGMRQNL